MLPSSEKTLLGFVIKWNKIFPLLIKGWKIALTIAGYIQFTRMVCIVVMVDSDDQLQAQRQ